MRLQPAARQGVLVIFVPLPTFVNYTYPIQNKNYTIIYAVRYTTYSYFPRAAREAAQNNGCGPLS